MLGGDHCPAGGCVGDQFPALPLPSAGAEGWGTPASWLSEGADPGEAQPGVSFILAPSRSCPLIGAAGWQPSCHALVRYGPGA